MKKTNVRRLEIGEYEKLDKGGQMERICLAELKKTPDEIERYIGCPDVEEQIIKDRVLKKYQEMVKKIGHVDVQVRLFGRDNRPSQIHKIAICKRRDQFFIIIEEKLYRKISPDLVHTLHLI